MKKNSSTDSDNSKKITNTAQQLLVSSAISMSWQLAVGLLVPLLIGVWLDSHFKTAPLYSIIGLIIGIFMSSLIVWRSFRSLNQAALATLKSKKVDK